MSLSKYKMLFKTAYLTCFIFGYEHGLWADEEKLDPNTQILEVNTVSGETVQVRMNDLLDAYLKSFKAPERYAKNVQLLSKGSLLLEDPGFYNDDGRFYRIFVNRLDSGHWDNTNSKAWRSSMDVGARIGRAMCKHIGMSSLESFELGDALEDERISIEKSRYIVGDFPKSHWTLVRVSVVDATDEIYIRTFGATFIDYYDPSTDMHPVVLKAIVCR